MRVPTRTSIVSILACSRYALGCEGTGVMRLIEAAEHEGHSSALTAAIVLALVAAIALWRGRRMTAVALVALAIAHPGVWLGARSGDCGATLDLVAWPSTVVLVAIGGIVAFRLRKA